MTNQSHTLLGVTPTAIRHRETRPEVPERELDSRGTEISRINIILPEMNPAQQPLAEYTAVAPFLADNNDNTTFIGSLLCPIRSTPILGQQGPRILATIEDTTVPVLLDTGADLTVMSKEQMDALVHTRFHSESKPVTCFGGNKVFLEGPKCLRLELCGVKLVHPVYVVDYPSPVIVGFDAILAAQLIIDAHRRVAYSHFNYKGRSAKTMSACPNVETPGVEPARHLCTLSFDPPCMSVVESCISTPVFEHFGAAYTNDGARADELAETPIPFRPACPDSETAVSNPTPPAVHPDKANETPNCCELELPAMKACPSVVAAIDVAEVNTVGDEEAIMLLKHLHMLFDATRENGDINPSNLGKLKSLLLEHRDTFASSNTDLGFSSVLQHDIDTGDTQPVRKQPRRPPIAAQTAED